MNRRAKEKKRKSFTPKMQAKLLLVFCVITILLVALMGRLIYIMQTDGERFAKQVLSRQTYVSSVLPYKRGDILDRNGTILARSELHYRLILDPLLLNEAKDNITPTVNAVSKSFGMEPETITSILEEKPNSRYVIVQKNLNYDAVQSFKAIMEEDNTIKGVWFEEEYVRSYPYKTLACDVLGFTSADNTGYWGIEEYYNNELNGTNGREYGYYDADLNIERIVKKAENGNNIVSTIDANAQRIIQEHIAKFNTEFGSKNIGVLVMNPNNGEVLAMASNQEYDLNSPRDLSGSYTEDQLAGMNEDQKMEALNTLWRNDVISYIFEPGSTFKPVTIAAGLEENVLHVEDTFFCDGGETINGVHVKCSKVTGHGEVTLEQALMLSCNDALMQIGAIEGKNIFYRYQNSFGFGKKTGIDLPGEESGLTQSVDKVVPIDLATNSFGQNISVTMLQLVSAYSSLVNGGFYYQPHVVKKVVNDKGATVKEFDGLLVKQTVSEETSEFLQEATYQTVEAGTAGGAKVEGYAIGGKTGTAQKIPRTDKTYIVSFIGQAPAINPEIVIYVMIDEPQNVVKQANSAIATEFAGRIMKQLLPALGIYPEGDIDYLLTDDEKTANSNTTNGTTTGGISTNGTTTGGNPASGNTTAGNTGSAGSSQNNSNTGNSGDEENTGNTTNENGNNPDDLQSGEQESNAENGDNAAVEGSTNPEDTGNADTEEIQDPGSGNENEFNADALE